MLLDAPADPAATLFQTPTHPLICSSRGFCLSASALELPAIRLVRIDKLNGIYIHVAPHVVYLFYCLLPFFIVPSSCLPAAKK